MELYLRKHNSCLTNAIIFIHIIQGQLARGIMLCQKSKQLKVRQHLYSQELTFGTSRRFILSRSVNSHIPRKIKRIPHSTKHMMTIKIKSFLFRASFTLSRFVLIIFIFRIFHFLLFTIISYFCYLG